MEEQPAVKTVGFQHRPAPSRHLLVLVEPVERELDGRESVARDDSIVELGLDRDEPNVAVMIPAE